MGRYRRGIYVVVCMTILSRAAYVDAHSPISEDGEPGQTTRKRIEGYATPDAAPHERGTQRVSHRFCETETTKTPDGVSTQPFCDVSSHVCERLGLYANKCPRKLDRVHSSVSGRVHRNTTATDSIAEWTRTLSHVLSLSSSLQFAEEYYLSKLTRNLAGKLIEASSDWHEYSSDLRELRRTPTGFVTMPVTEPKPAVYNGRWTAASSEHSYTSLETWRERRQYFKPPLIIGVAAGFAWAPAAWWSAREAQDWPRVRDRMADTAGVLLTPLFFIGVWMANMPCYAPSRILRGLGQVLAAICFFVAGVIALLLRFIFYPFETMQDIAEYVLQPFSLILDILYVAVFQTLLTVRRMREAAEKRRGRVSQKPEEYSDDESCAICLEPLGCIAVESNEPVLERDERVLNRLKCGHGFHRDCLVLLASSSHKHCPVCRQRIPAPVYYELRYRAWASGAQDLAS